MRNVAKQTSNALPSLSLFYDAFSDHAFLFLCVSMHLETDLSAQEDNHKNHQRNASLWVSSLVDPSLVHSSSVARCGGTRDLDTISSFGIFFWGIGPRGLAHPPPLECNSTLPLVTAVLITPKGAQPPGSCRIGVIGALVLILPSETV